MLRTRVSHDRIGSCVRNIYNLKRISMSHRCFVKIYTKHAVQRSSDTTRGITHNFSKYMDDFIAELPSRILEHRESLHLHEDITEDQGIFISLDPGHDFSRLPDVLLEVIIELSSNGKKKRSQAEHTFTRIVCEHFAPAKIPNFTVEVFVQNRS